MAYHDRLAGPNGEATAGQGVGQPTFVAAHTAVDSLRLALESLGPIFVKFGQVLSTRRDLLPADIADELARLQDRVPPFGSDIAIATI